MRKSPFSVLLLLICLGVGRQQALGEIQYVIAISIDGGRGDYIQSFINSPKNDFPGFKRLRDMGASTFSANCDDTESITIPDHLSMLTGRPVRQPANLPDGLAHGIITDAPAASETIHNSGLEAGSYKSSIFDVVHDRGLSTALYMGKTRLLICGRSWDATNGALDMIGADNGRLKIDFTHIVEASNNPMATPGLLNELLATIKNGTLKNFTMWHVADTDYAGHASGWSSASGSGYSNAMKLADGWLGQILTAVQNNASLTGKVAIMLTSDHGGTTVGTHTNAADPADYIIPFMLAAPGIAPGSSIYDYFENRFDVGALRPTYDNPRQPMRNGDVANLSTALLGLPSVPGSLMVPRFKKNLKLSQSGNALSISWPIYLTASRLESTTDLNADQWVPVPQVEVARNAGQNVYTFALSPPGHRFFRLRDAADSVGATLSVPMKKAPTPSAPKRKGPRGPLRSAPGAR